MSEPVLPYGGVTQPENSGWSGSDTSQARTEQADLDGTTARRQAEAMRLLREAGERGLTWTELAEAADLHHGSASGVLSVLHKVGRIARLQETRDRCKVYVRLGYVADRPTEPHGGRSAADRYVLPDPKCQHRRQPVRVTSHEDLGAAFDSGEPYASTFCCERDACVEDARAWVQAFTGREAVVL